MHSQTAEMLRLARTPKWLGLAAIAIAIVIGCIVLGRWQYDRTYSILQAERVAQAAPIPIEEAVSVDEGIPGESIGRPVTASGEYLANAQVSILHRSREGKAGVWILTPLQLAGGDIIGVLRGWLPTPDAPGAIPPGGPVNVAGIVHPDEPFYADATGEPGTAIAISSERLRGAWGPRTLPGYVMLTSQEPAAAPAPLPVPAVVQTADVPFPLRNFVYAFQWWVFAGFAVVVYFRWLWLDAARAREAATTVVSS